MSDFKIVGLFFVFLVVMVLLSGCNSSRDDGLDGIGSDIVRHVERNKNN